MFIEPAEYDSWSNRRKVVWVCQQRKRIYFPTQRQADIKRAAERSNMSKRARYQIPDLKAEINDLTAQAKQEGV